MKWFRLVSAGLLLAGVAIAQSQAATAGASCRPAAKLWANLATAKTELASCPKGNPPTAGQQRATSEGGKSVKPACVWVPEPGYQPGPGQKAGGSGGQWYRKFCSFGKYDTLADFEQEMSGWDVMNTRQSNMMNQAGLDIQWFATPPPVPRRTPQQVMASVVGELPFPKTFIAVSPVATKQIVGVPTWVWLTDESGQFVPARYQPDSKTIVLEGYPLKWQIVPSLTVSPGTGGQEQTCEGAGLPWSESADGNPGACTVAYDRSGHYTLSANVGWTVQWWLDGVQQGDITGPTNTATRAVTVLEIQALGR